MDLQRVSACKDEDSRGGGIIVNRGYDVCGVGIFLTEEQLFSLFSNLPEITRLQERIFEGLLEVSIFVFVDEWRGSPLVESEFADRVSLISFERSTGPSLLDFPPSIGS